MKRVILTILLFLLFSTPALSQTKKKRVADKKFWIAAAVIVAASALDVESTAYWQKACPTCREVNSWLYGKRPSRKRMYLTLGAIAAAEIAGMWWVKRYDQQQGTNVWLVVPIAHTVGHGGAAWYNYSKNYPPKCPALGAGCAK